MRQLLESGAHFGHRQQRWNPKMAPFIYGQRNDIHILDLTQTVPLLHRALVTLRETAAGGGRILFVGTKRQASEPIAAAAKRLSSPDSMGLLFKVMAFAHPSLAQPEGFAQDAAS